MGLHTEKVVPSAHEIREQYPLSDELKAVKEARDAEIKDVFTGASDKFVVIIGPCSADNEDAVCDYVQRLARVNEQTKDKLLIIPRIYTNKPRTTGEGYKGILHQPDPEKKPDMVQGIIAIRHMFLRSLEETHLTAADEMLYPGNWRYMEDILSYVAVGARSVENQQHRLVASGIDVPVGMKNPTSGDLSVMINAVIAAQGHHTFLYHHEQVKSDGNPLTHTILRGSQDQYGQNIPNYHYENFKMLIDYYAQHELLNPACIVDANHCNSGKKFDQQPRIVKEVLHSRKLDKDIHNFVKGVMIESYIEDGNQKIGEGIYGKSITDPCLGWDKTEKLLYEIADRL